MRETDETSGSLFSCVDLEDHIPAQHRPRKIRQVVNDALVSLDGEFAAICADFGRPSIATERLIRASLIQILFSIRSEGQLMEQIQYTLMFRWFVGLGFDDPVWVPTVFTENRDRLLTTEMSRKFMAANLAHSEVKQLLSDEHFSVDGTLIKAWVSMKRIQSKADTAPPDQADGRLFSETIPYFVFQINHASFARFDDSPFGKSDIWMNVINVEAGHGTTDASLFEAFYGQPQDWHTAGWQEIAAFSSCVSQPLEWAGLLIETCEKRADKQVIHVFKTVLWRSALNLETDDMLRPITFNEIDVSWY